jgi:hypothetical protein
MGPPPAARFVAVTDDGGVGPGKEHAMALDVSAVRAGYPALADGYA